MTPREEELSREVDFLRNELSEAIVALGHLGPIAKETSLAEAIRTAMASISSYSERWDETMRALREAGYDECEHDPSDIIRLARR